MAVGGVVNVDFNKFKDWALLGLLSGGVFILWQMKENVSQLNTRIEIMVETQHYDRKEINDHEARIRAIEQNK